MKTPLPAGAMDRGTVRAIIHALMTRPLFRVFLLALLLLSGGWRARAVDCNALVLEAIKGMPEYGTYSASKASFDGLTRAITVRGSSLVIDPLQARPSFCSGATYIVFVRALERLAAQGAVNMDPATLQALLIAGQRDGQGIWGRWNANGPGTARLFSELQLGHNFCEFSEARPGDFMKIFWTDEIGKKERGHSVIYLGSKKVGSQEYIQFWSSNLPTLAGDRSGYGEKLVLKSKMARVIFSRLERPANIAQARTVAGTDTFLAGLLTRSATMDDVKRMCGL
jgi:hypothetical protein